MSGIADEVRGPGPVPVDPEALRSDPDQRSDFLAKLLDSCANEYFDDPREGIREISEIARSLVVAYEGRDDATSGPTSPRMGSGGSMSAPDVGSTPRRPRPFALGRELAVYQARLPEFLETHPDEYVLIKGDDVIGFFASFEGALTGAYQRFGNVPFFIKQVGAKDVVVLLPRTV